METLSSSPVADQQPSFIRYALGFLLVGIAWGGTTPFMRRAALHAPPPSSSPRSANFILRTLHSLISTLSNPSYALPLVINITGSIWFFLLIGSAELSLTVPITNALAFLCTVGAEFVAEGRGVGKDTWIGMALVLAGIALCVWSKA